MSRLRRWLSSGTEDDVILATIELPSIVVVGLGVLAILVAAGAVVGSLVMDDGDDRLNIGLPLLTVVPFVANLVGKAPTRDARARWTLAAFVLAPNAALTVGGWLDWPVDVNEFGFGASFALYLILLMMAVFALAPRRDAAIVVAAAYLVYATRALLEEDSIAMASWLSAITFLTVSTVGIRLGALAIARAQHALAAQAAADDRRRIARDVHDVVAHTLAVTMLHVTAARMAVIRSSRDDAVEALEEAERNGRASLGDIRRIVRLLRSEDDGDTAVDAAQPDLTDIPTLVEGYRAAGLDVGMTLAGSTERVSATVGLALYRVTQEALANAARHGEGPATVDLRVIDGEVTLSVRNGASKVRTNRNGSGLVGMEERVLAAGGKIDVGKRNGAWVVNARVPLNEPTGGAS